MQRSSHVGFLSEMCNCTLHKKERADAAARAAAAAGVPPVPAAHATRRRRGAARGKYSAPKEEDVKRKMDLELDPVIVPTFSAKSSRRKRMRRMAKEQRGEATAAGTGDADDGVSESEDDGDNDEDVNDQSSSDDAPVPADAGAHDDNEFSSGQDTPLASDDDGPNHAARPAPPAPPSGDAALTAWLTGMVDSWCASLGSILVAFQSSSRWPTTGLQKHMSLCMRCRSFGDDNVARCCEWIAWEPGYDVAAMVGRAIPVQARAGRPGSAGRTFTYHAGYKHPGVSVPGGPTKPNVITWKADFDTGELNILHHTGVEHSRFGADLPDDLSVVYRAWMRACSSDFASTRPCSHCSAADSPACCLCDRARCCPPESMLEQLLLDSDIDLIAQLERHLAVVLKDTTQYIGQPVLENLERKHRPIGQPVL